MAELPCLWGRLLGVIPFNFAHASPGLLPPQFAFSGVCFPRTLIVPSALEPLGAGGGWRGEVW